MVSTAIRSTNPELVEAQRRGLASDATGRRAGLGDGRPTRRSPSRAPRQDHDDLAADGGHAALRAPTRRSPSAATSTSPAPTLINGSGDVFVAEADESDGSFLLYSPYAAIVTNVEADHLDHYGTAEAVEEAFDAFVERIDDRAASSWCAPTTPAAGGWPGRARGHGIDVRTYGEAADADLRVVDVALSGSASTFSVVTSGGRFGLG